MSLKPGNHILRLFSEKQPSTHLRSRSKREPTWKMGNRSAMLGGYICEGQRGPDTLFVHSIEVDMFPSISSSSMKRRPQTGCCSKRDGGLYVPAH